jgi:hypothetical protein
MKARTFADALAFSKQTCHQPPDRGLHATLHVHGTPGGCWQSRVCLSPIQGDQR